jgi:hypothetical protein
MGFLAQTAGYAQQHISGGLGQKPREVGSSSGFRLCEIVAEEEPVDYQRYFRRKLG